MFRKVGESTDVGEGPKTNIQYTVRTRLTAGGHTYTDTQPRSRDRERMFIKHIAKGRGGSTGGDELFTRTNSIARMERLCVYRSRADKDTHKLIGRKTG
ncbi:hypothetical protein NECAME_10864 [Necator americanus]|uniref:Uncharacterized protein n=1 Tax=Necator americanus TaxID=51031 RepID=W2T7W9_NECAM|nr:hypothetical protein NECAME_10864 [Necator americanus]ETN77714.1 hypothetical protein NECAME_10864 [Necator americanus]